MAVVNLIVIASVVVALALVLIAWDLYRKSDWDRLRLVRKGVIVHLPTDPVCIRHTTPPPPGSRLYRAAAGVPCPVCDRPVSNDHTTGDSPW